MNTSKYSQIPEKEQAPEPIYPRGIYQELDRPFLELQEEFKVRCDNWYKKEKSSTTILPNRRTEPSYVSMLRIKQEIINFQHSSQSPVLTFMEQFERSTQ